MDDSCLRHISLISRHRATPAAGLSSCMSRFLTRRARRARRARQTLLWDHPVSIYSIWSGPNRSIWRFITFEHSSNQGCPALEIDSIATATSERYVVFGEASIPFDSYLTATRQLSHCHITNNPVQSLRDRSIYMVSGWRLGDQTVSTEDIVPPAALGAE